MRYFCTPEERKSSRSSCYLEFQPFRSSGRRWLSDSIFLHDDVFEALGLYPVFKEAIPHFAHWGITEISREQYDRLMELGRDHGGEILAALNELDAWAQSWFTRGCVMTICGI